MHDAMLLHLSYLFSFADFDAILGHFHFGCKESWQVQKNIPLNDNDLGEEKKGRNYVR
jgi:hypothetical protein